MIAAKQDPGRPSLIDRFNSTWHERTMWLFTFIVFSHWIEHIVQSIQIYWLGWPRPEALGFLGLALPWLVRSEWLHYGHALVMLLFLLLLRRGMVGRPRLWWDITIGLSIWHHLEHFLLLAQVMFGFTLFGKAAPTSILQLVIPRVELHLFYNAIISLPMVIAMALHMNPTKTERKAMTCTCGRHVGRLHRA
ncbi:MAG TPA: hypothetical protein VK191_07285 [Symbiobacteriaceae bacterium]|nr:hypothetical protein [Symbiobacteriaceae bacterium]